MIQSRLIFYPRKILSMSKMKVPGKENMSYVLTLPPILLMNTDTLDFLHFKALLMVETSKVASPF